MQDFYRFIVIGALSQAVFLGGVFAAASAGLNAGVSALICSLQPMVVTVGAKFFFDEKLGRKGFTLILGLGGVVMSVGPLRLGGAGGLWLVGLSLFALSGATLLERAWPSPVSVGVSLSGQALITTAIFTVWAGMSGDFHVHMTMKLGEATTWLVIMSGLGGYLSFTVCIRRCGPSQASLLLYLSPVVTLVWAWVMFGQTPSIMQVAGGILILCALGFSKR